MTNQERKIMNEYVLNDISIIDFDTFKTVLESHDYFIESYFGKSQTLIEIENVLGDMIQSMKESPLLDYSNDVRNKRLQELIKKQFGFNKVYIQWKRTAEYRPNIMTLFTSDIILKGSSIVTIDKRKGYYDKNHKHTCIIHASSTLPSQMTLTSQEYTAVLLHEIGHNFDYSPYMVINYIFKILEAIINTVVMSSMKLPTDGLSKSEKKLVLSTIGKNVATVSILSTLPPIRIAMEELNLLLENILKHIPVAKKLSYYINGVTSKIQKGFELFSAPLNLLAFPMYIGMSPLVHLLSIPERKTEIFADSFAISYGYGSELASALTKLEKANMLNVSLLNTKEPNKLASIMKDIAMLQRYVVSAFVRPSHGPIDERISKSIDVISNDIKTGNYSPEIEKELRLQLNDLKKMYDYYMNIGDDSIKLTISTWGRNAIHSIFDGDTNMINKWFPDNIA